MNRAHRILSTVLSPFGNAAVLKVIAGGLPFVPESLGETVAGFVHKHFKSGKIVEQAFLKSLDEAERLVQAWIKEKRKVHTHARGDNLLQRGRNAPLAEFPAWAEKRGLGERWESFLKNSDAKQLRQHLIAECSQIAEQLRRQIRENELTETQLIESLVAAAGSASDGDQPNLVEGMVPADTLLYHFCVYRRFDFFTEAFAVGFHCILAESPEIRALLELNTKRSIDRAQTTLRTQLQQGFDAGKESLDEVGRQVLANRERLKRIEQSISEATESEMAVQQTAKRLKGHLAGKLEGLAISLRTDLAENRRKVDEVLTALHRLEAARNTWSTALVEPTNSARRLMQNAQAELLRHSPDAANVSEAIEKLVLRYRDSGNVAGACTFLQQVLDRHADRAPASIYQAAFQAEVEWNNGGRPKMPAKWYNRMLELEPERALFPEDYEMVSLLGRGQFGPVFLVKKKRVGVQFALKVLDPRDGIMMTHDFRREVENHVKAAAGDPTGTIVKILDAEDPDNQTARRPFVLLEYVRGKTLAELYNYRFRKLREADAFEPVVAAIFHRILRAVEYLHGREKSIVHRDLHQNNFMIERSGAVRLIDFGLSKLLDTKRKDGTSAWTYAARSICTAAVIAPESDPPRPDLQRRPTFDVYYLGHLGAFLYTKKEHGFDSVPDERIRQVLEKAVEREPADRFANAGEMREAFEAAIGGAPNLPNDAIRIWASNANSDIYSDIFAEQSARRQIEEKALKGDVTSIDRDGVRIVANGQTYLIPPDQVSHTREDYQEACIYLRDARDIRFQPSHPAPSDESNRENCDEPLGSIVAATPNPWNGLAEKLEVGVRRQNVRVERITSRGVLVEVTRGLHGVSAFVPTTELGVVFSHTPMKPKHWVAVGERIPQIELTDIDPANQSIVASCRSIAATGIVEWQASLRQSREHEGVVIFVNNKVVVVSLGSPMDAPVALMTAPEFAEQLSLTDPRCAVGRRLGVELEDPACWPEKPLTIARIAMLPEKEQMALRRATVTRIEPSGHFAELKVYEDSGEMAGRLLCRDYTRQQADILHTCLDVGSVTWVRRVRKRISGGWDYCAPDLRNEPESTWMPGDGELVELRLTNVSENTAIGVLPGEAAATVPRYLLRSRYVRERYQASEKPHLYSHLRPDYFFRRDQRIEGYVLRSNGRVEFCPRWSEDDAYVQGYLEKEYKPKTVHTGVIAWTTNGEKREVYVLLEPGIEACYQPSSSDDDQSMTWEMLAAHVGRRVRVEVVGIDRIHRTVRVKSIEPED